MRSPKFRSSSFDLRGTSPCTALLLLVTLFAGLVRPVYSSDVNAASFIRPLDASYPDLSSDNTSATLSEGGKLPLSVSITHIVELRVRQFLTASASVITSVTLGGGSCPANYNGCSNLGAPGVCCTSTAVCSLDEAAHVACCPSGSACTGTIAVSTVSGATVTTFSTIDGAGAFTFASTIANQYFLFPVIPTTFANAAICTTAYSTCQAEYSSCLSQLGGLSTDRTDGLTISASLGGTTIGGGATATVSLSNAADICSSLSQQACFGLQTQFCSAYGSATSGSNSGTGSSAARRNAGDFKNLMAILVVPAGFLVLW